jgi:tetratricopeptide (TPR) repeat protein
MKNKYGRLWLLIALTLVFMVVACAAPSGEKSAHADSEPDNQRELRKIFRDFLPQGAFLIEPSQDGVTLPQPALVQEADLDNDGADELIAGFRISETEVGVLILEQGGSGWQKMWEARGNGPGLALLYPADINGDGTPELLLGWGQGSDLGNVLNIVSFQGEIKNLVQEPYHRLDVMDLPSDYGTDGKCELAIWNRVGSGTYEVEVHRLYDGRLIPALDTYTSYFSHVVDYYEQQVLAMPDKPSLWYYLADAQIKAGQPGEALRSIELASGFDSDQPRPGALAVLKGDALLAEGKLQQALATYPKLARVDPQGIDCRDKARAFYGLGRVKELLPGLDLGAAKSDYKRALAADPDWLLPAFALGRIEALPITDNLTLFLANLPPKEKYEQINTLANFAQEHGLNIHYQIQCEDHSQLCVLAVDYGFQDSTAKYLAHALFWWDQAGDGPIRRQMFYCSEAPLHGLGENCVVEDLDVMIGSDGIVKAEVIYLCPRRPGSGKLRYEFQLDGDKWTLARRVPVQDKAEGA